MAYSTFQFYHHIDWKAFVQFHQLKPVTFGMWLGKYDESYNFFFETMTGMMVCVPEELQKDLSRYAPNLLPKQKVQEVLQAVKRSELEQFYNQLS